MPFDIEKDFKEPLERTINPENIARRLGGEVSEPKGRMLEYIKQAMFWIPGLRRKRGERRQQTSDRTVSKEDK